MRMIRSVIKKYSDDVCYRNQIIGLVESLPNDTTPDIIESAVSVIEALNRYEELSSSDEEKLLLKHHRDELIINVLSRFNILDDNRVRSSNWKDESVKNLLKHADASGFKIDQYRDYFGISEINEEEAEQSTKAVC